MRALMTADTVGGVWSYALELSRALERHDVEIVLATMGAPLSPAQRDDVRRCHNITLRESRYRLEWMPDPWSDVAAAGEWLLDLERAVQPDVVHLNGYAHAALPWRSPVLVAGHSCVLSWWRAVHGCAAPSAWDRYRAAVTAGLRNADLVVAPTRYMLNALLTHYGSLRAGCVVPNGCDAAVLPLGARDAFGRYARAATLPRPFVLAAGRAWDESKNLAALAAAAPRIAWPVYVAGSDLHPSGERRPLDGVHRLGVLPQAALWQWYRRASIFVQPSVYEPFGLAPLEAAIQRTALVLGDIAPLREVWGDAAVYVPPRAPAAIADAVNGLAAQPQRLAEYAEAARRRAAGLTARRMARAYTGLYRSLARSRRSRPATEAFACV
jgi:glycogen synthase